MDHQNLSEHVLCMVLYLIELGLENSPEQESEEEVSANICMPFVMFATSIFWVSY